MALTDYLDLVPTALEHGFGFRDVSACYDHLRDGYIVRMTVDASEARRAAEGGDVRRLGKHLESRVAEALRVLRYAHRKVPRLGAGTRGYRKRSR